MNRESIPTRKVGSIERPGDYAFADDFGHIYVWLPGASGPDAIAIQLGQPGGPRVWGWDGNEDAPTLTPSIDDHNWHGYLRAGKLESC